MPWSRIAVDAPERPKASRGSDDRETGERFRRLDVLDAYRRAWECAPDEHVVRSWLTRCWREDSWYFNPFCDPIHGIDALLDLILDYPLMFPGFRITPGRPVALTPGSGLYHWKITSWLPIRIKDADFGCLMTGRDIVSFARDDRIRLVVTLIDGLEHPGSDACPVQRMVECADSEDPGPAAR
jgi:hypothetical protein